MFFQIIPGYRRNTAKPDTPCEKCAPPQERYHDVQMMWKVITRIIVKFHKHYNYHHHHLLLPYYDITYLLTSSRNDINILLVAANTIFSWRITRLVLVLASYLCLHNNNAINISWSQTRNLELLVISCGALVFSMMIINRSLYKSRKFVKAHQKEVGSCGKATNQSTTIIATTCYKLSTSL